MSTDDPTISVIFTKVTDACRPGETPIECVSRLVKNLDFQGQVSYLVQKVQELEIKLTQANMVINSKVSVESFKIGCLESELKSIKDDKNKLEKLSKSKDTKIKSLETELKQQKLSFDLSTKDKIEFLEQEIIKYKNQLELINTKNKSKNNRRGAKKAKQRVEGRRLR